MDFSRDLISIIDLWEAIRKIRIALDYIPVTYAEFEICRDMYLNLYDRLHEQFRSLNSEDADFFMAEYGFPDFLLLK